MLHYSHTIKEWFLSHRRELPWRTQSTPYRVWISEVMLQQTQVAVVIPYFERWMERFPTIESLAHSPLQEVLKVWEGLGYYSRARHLHEAAGSIVTRYGGELPSAPDALATIKGIGPYTQGAILAFAFRQKAVAVDGNVVRVLSRFFGVEEPIELSSTRKRVTQLAEALLPDEEPWLVSEGLIELGALVCKKAPLCHECPLKRACVAFRDQKSTLLPCRKARPETIRLERMVAIVRCGEKILVQKREKGEVMADLFEFPYLEKKGDAKELFETALGLELQYLSALKSQQHTFTQFKVQLFPHLFLAKKEDERYQWERVDHLSHLPFSAGHKRILNGLVGS